MKPFIFLFLVYKKSLTTAIIRVLLWLALTLHNAKPYGRLTRWGFDTTSVRMPSSCRLISTLLMFVLLQMFLSLQTFQSEPLYHTTLERLYKI